MIRSQNINKRKRRKGGLNSSTLSSGSDPNRAQFGHDRHPATVGCDDKVNCKVLLRDVLSKKEESRDNMHHPSSSQLHNSPKAGPSNSIYNSHPMQRRSQSSQTRSILSVQTNVNSCSSILNNVNYRIVNPSFNLGSGEIQNNGVRRMPSGNLVGNQFQCRVVLDDIGNGVHVRDRDTNIVKSRLLEIEDSNIVVTVVHTSILVYSRFVT